MKTRPLHRAFALALAALVTLATLGGIDELASLPSASSQWADALVAPRG
ncbi:MAG: hypothetical protein KGL78_09280 [Burkholderiales bacterium]|nr:hypothetical protein [Burkholderiales bacterium]